MGVHSEQHKQGDSQSRLGGDDVRDFAYSKEGKEHELGYLEQDQRQLSPHLEY